MEPQQPQQQPAQAETGPSLSLQQVQELAQQAWSGASAVAVLRRYAVSELFKSNGPAGAHTMSAALFRQVLQHQGDGWAWANCPSFEGSKVKTVMVGAEMVFKAKYVPGETSKAVVLDLDGLKELAADPSKSTEYAPPTPQAPVAAPAGPPQGPAFIPPAPTKGKAAKSAPPPAPPPDFVPTQQELTLCTMAMAVYRHTDSIDPLTTLRCKLACMLARLSDTPLGAHTMLGTHLGDALGKVAPEAWQALPSAGSRLQRLADRCLLVEQHTAGVVMRLDIQELEKAAVARVAQECASLNPVLGSRRMSSAQVSQAGGAGMGGDSAVPPTRHIQPGGPFPPDIGLDVSGNVPSPRDDDFGLAVGAALLSVWGSRKWHLTAGGLAMLGQPGSVAQRNGGRHCSHVGFFIKEVQRVAAFARVPASELSPKYIAQAEPLLAFGAASGGATGGIVSVQLRQLARTALAAAVPGALDLPGGAKWPPVTQDLQVSQLHQQAQPLARYLVQVLSGAEGPEARAAMLSRCLQQLEFLAGPPTTPSAAQSALQQTQAASSLAMALQQQAAGLSGQLQAVQGHQAQQVLQLPMQMLQGRAVQLGQQQAIMLGPAGAMRTGQQVVLQTQQPGMQPVYANLSSLQQAATDQLQVRQQVASCLQAAYPGTDPQTMLRRRAILCLALAAQPGPAGPNSMLLSDLANKLAQDESSSWQACFGTQDTYVASQVAGLLNGFPGLQVVTGVSMRPGATVEATVRLDLPSLSRAAGQPPAQPGGQGGIAIGGQQQATSNTGRLLQLMQNHNAAMAGAGLPQGTPPGQSVLFRMLPQQNSITLGQQQGQLPGAPSGAQVFTMQQAANQSHHVSMEHMGSGNSVVGTPPGSGQHMGPSLGMVSQLNSMATPFVSMEPKVQPHGQQHGQQQAAHGQAPGNALHGDSPGAVASGAVAAALSGGQLRPLGGFSVTLPGSTAAPQPLATHSSLTSTPHSSLTNGRLSAGLSNIPVVTATSTSASNIIHPQGSVNKGPGQAQVNQQQSVGLMGALGSALQQAATAEGAVPMDVSSISSQQLVEWAAAAFPGDDPVHVVRRAAVKLLSEARNGPGGPFSMDGPSLGLALAKAEAEAYRQLPCSSQGKLRLKAVCDNSPCFARIHTHQTQVCVRLNVQELARAAASGGAAPLADMPPAPPGTLVPGSLSAEVCAKWRPTAPVPGQRRAGSPAPDAALVQRQEQLCAMADLVYPAWDPLKELKLHAVYLLAGCISPGPAGGSSASDAGSRTRPLGDHSMMGPEFGNIMSRKVPVLWGNVPGAKLNRLCTGDPYLQASAAGDNRAIRLDVPVLMAAAAEQYQLAVSKVPEGQLSKVPEGLSKSMSQGSDAVASTTTAVSLFEAQSTVSAPAALTTDSAGVAAATPAALPVMPSGPILSEPSVASSSVGGSIIKLNAAAKTFRPPGQAAAPAPQQPCTPSRLPPSDTSFGSSVNGTASPGSHYSGPLTASTPAHTSFAPPGPIGPPASYPQPPSQSALPTAPAAGALAQAKPFTLQTGGRPMMPPPGSLQPMRSYSLGDDSSLDGAFQHQEAALLHLIAE